MTRILVSELKPNPFRDMANYPLNADKIEALKKSINDTGFWDNLLVRKSPDGDGYEMAYGHHRREALRKAKVSEIDIPVRKLDDTHMAQIMAHENMEEWGHSASIEQETIRSIVVAFGKGRINLPSITTHPTGGNYYSASSTAPFSAAPIHQIYREAESNGSSRPALYSIESLSGFLGWKEYKVQGALHALALIEQNVAKPETFVGLSSRQASEVSKQAARVLRDTKDPVAARSVARGLSAGFRKSVGKQAAGDKKAVDVTIHNARRIANDLSGVKVTKPKKLPDFGRFIEGLRKAAVWYFENKKEQWAAAVQFREEMPAEDRKHLIAALRDLAKRATRMAEKMEA